MTADCHLDHFRPCGPRMVAASRWQAELKSGVVRSAYCTVISARSNMRYGLPAVVLIAAATLSGCTEGVLDPKGPIAAADRQILLNSLGIMLAIVIPVILATLGVAFWFRASN